MLTGFLLLVLYVALLGGVYWLCGFVGVPAPFLKIILVILVVVAILLVLQFFGVSPLNIPTPKPLR